MCQKQYQWLDMYPRHQTTLDQGAQPSLLYKYHQDHGVAVVLGGRVNGDTQNLRIVLLFDLKVDNSSVDLSTVSRP